MPQPTTDHHAKCELSPVFGLNSSIPAVEWKKNECNGKKNEEQLRANVSFEFTRQPQIGIPFEKIETSVILDT